MIYGSVCSGVEAATTAWHPLGWRPAFFSEIEPFPSAVLAHRYAQTPNLGDMTKFKEWPDATLDLLVGGTPCQSFSVAGLRKGLDDPRGSLMLTYLAIARRYRPRWLVWENVPGVLSADKGRAFGTLLGGMAELGYGFAYRVLDAQYVRTLGLPFAVPQRRRRVFVVGYFGDWRRAAAVLFDGESLSGAAPPLREAGKGASRGFETGPHGGGLIDVAPTLDARCKDGPIRNQIGAGVMFPISVAPTLRAGGNSTGGDRPYGTDADTVESLVPILEPIVLMERGRNGSPNLEWRQDGTANALLTPNGGRGGLGAVAYGHNGGPPLWRVRRLSPRECERLQGFPDDFTDIPWRGRMHSPDGPRYKAMGNSMAVNVMQWIGERIENIESICGGVSL